MKTSKLKLALATVAAFGAMAAMPGPCGQDR